MKAPSFLSGVAVFCVAVLAACGSGGGGGGGGSSTSSSSLSGVFADSPVAGLTYVINGVSAKTDATGHFTYKSGDSITFKVGDIVLGTAVGKPFLSPVALAGAADETNDTATNIAKFLQTIDDNNNPTDGILLTTAVHTAANFRTINFAQTTANYDGDFAVTSAYTALTTATTSGAHAGVSDANARTHMRNTLLTAMAGTYSGSYSGSGSGTFTFTTNSAGVITSGQIVQAPPSPPIAIVGNISSAGVFASLNNPGFIGATPVNLNLNGTISVGTSTVSGTWTIVGGGYNFSGNFSGQK